MAKNSIIKKIFGTKQEHDLKKLVPVLHEINSFESWAISLKPEKFPDITAELKTRLEKGETLDDILPEAFALTREAARRTLGERLYDVQMLGALVLHQGKIMEMKTGEGKTLSCVPAAYLNALPGDGVHIVTVNEYLAERDADWMRPIYSYLGLEVGVILSSLDNEARKHAYTRDITYGTNNEFGFDYLRDNMKLDAGQKLQPKHSYGIIDEIDSILIDEARTPLIISGQADDDTKKFFDVNRIAPSLKECGKDPETGEYLEEPDEDYQLDEKSRRVTFTNSGMDSVERLLNSRGVFSGSIFSDENFEYIHYATQAVKALTLYNKDVEYVVADGQVQIVDEFTGRILHGRRYSDGLHQAIEAKEGIKIAKRNRTLATITFQNFFRMYGKISGMTGTADTEASEFAKIYGLDVVVIPTNRPVTRKDEHDLIYFNDEFKYKAIIEEITRAYKIGQPMLVGTVTIESSELISRLLTKCGLQHEVLNAKNHSREALIISEAGAKNSITIATNMAGRGTDIKLGGNPEYRARKRCGTDASPEEFMKAYTAELEKWQKDYKEVKELGGLYILGTERHESRRIDNQLRGRSGRQGDPGFSRFYLSLDDNLMRLFARDNLKALMGRVMNSGEPIYHSMITKAIEKAQSRVEERNFDIRKHLLDYDDVLNEQRNFIYSQRDIILGDSELNKRIVSSSTDIIEDFVDEIAGTSTIQPQQVEKIHELFFDNFRISADIGGLENSTRPEKIQKLFTQAVRDDLDQKSTKVGIDVFNSFLRYHYLKHIDSRWQDHLETMEALREAVYLRSYAQKNPLLEYKLEGFDIFDTMLSEIKGSIAKLAVRVQISDKPTIPHRKNRAVQGISEQHSNIAQFSSNASPSPGGKTRDPASSQGQPGSVQVRRTVEKVGRNDPCPCGSGKKYKHCCGS